MQDDTVSVFTVDKSTFGCQAQGPVNHLYWRHSMFITVMRKFMTQNVVTKFPSSPLYDVLFWSPLSFLPPLASFIIVTHSLIP